MGARFTKGDSVKTTRTLTAQSPPSNVRTRSHSLRGGNTMSGMPGYIDAHQTEAMDGAKGGKGFGPHREGPVGKRGSSGAKEMGKGEAGCGTVTESYHASSTGRAGPLKGNEHDGSTHVHTGNTTHKMPGQKAPPTSKGILGGTVRKAGIDRENPFKGGGIHAVVPKGHAGRMEKLSGKARTSYEGRRKSVMY